MMADEPVRDENKARNHDEIAAALSGGLTRREAKRWAAQLFVPPSAVDDPMVGASPPGGDHELFSRDEVVAAYSLLVSRKTAKRWAAELFAPAPPGTEGLYTHFGDDVLDLLSLVSEDCAERVRESFGIGPEEAAERRAQIRNRLQQRVP